MANPGTLTVSGSLNTTDIIIPISMGSRTNFNLLGNPFTSYVNSATFATTNSSLLSEETLWLWDGTKYVTYNAISPIELAPGQGFFVEASSSGNVTFAATNQSHQTTDTFIRAFENSYPTFELFVERQDEKNSTKVFYVDGKTTSFDNGYDSKMFSEDTSDLKIFTELITNNKGKKLAIQTLPNSGFENMIVPVGLQAKAGKSIEISVKGTNFPEGINVYLEDRINNVFTNLSEENYTITLDKDANGIGQFYIHTSSERLSTDNVNQLLENVSIYRSSKNQLTIAGLQSEKASLTLYSILGKKITTKKFKTNGTAIITLPEIASGVYVVELSSELGKLSKKIIVQ
ncbi:T9SS type A sorting domain-containing protein [Tenacibaculum sp. nBUS_03]|uniref:T9SS type A sorting domain-containing protein n=1 Tax=Tenacibaculum sp. nBUS_03 TaxID=3395320 RepID=UPI003EBED10E